VYLAGNVILDPIRGQDGVLVAKLSQGAAYVYTTFINGSTKENAAGITVDQAGNAYIVGTTFSSDFPVTATGNLGTPPAGVNDNRPFLVELNPSGAVVFSSFLGGQGTGQAVAIAADGGVLVTGYGGPSPIGSYSYGQPYLSKVNTAAGKLTFSNTGIGGGAMALDSSGNIFVAGNTNSLTYPTTPGAYQTTFPQKFVPCFSPVCQIALPGSNQYVTKVDPTGSTVIYSTGLNSPDAGMAINAGIAVDAAGNAYVTGTTVSLNFPFTTPVPSKAQTPPFLAKLDPTGHTLLFAVPQGGSGVQVDAQGHVYAGGILGQIGLFGPLEFLTVTPPPGLSAIPSGCLPNNFATLSEGYLVQADASSGALLAYQFLDGSDVASMAVAFAAPGGQVWIAGSVSAPDIPVTSSAFSEPVTSTGALPGAYLAAVNFSQAIPAGTPQIGCVLDAANFMHFGPVARGQLLTLYGANLGPSQGIVAPSGGSSTLAGVTVTFNGQPAQLLYVSSTQINVAIPSNVSPGNKTVMQVSVNAVTSASRAFWPVTGNPSLFASTATLEQLCNGGGIAYGYLAPTAMNADGSPNDCQHQAPVGSVVSLFVNGLGELPWNADVEAQLGAVGSLQVVASVAENPWVWRVDVLIPPVLSQPGANQAYLALTMQLGGQPAGPIWPGPIFYGSNAGQQLPVVIWVQPQTAPIP
jgi:uncharacterized protein (TIGR03437 family)